MSEILDRAHRTELHHAALEGDVVKIRQLLADGANPNAQDSNGFTPLHFAAQESHTDAIEVLIFCGADPELPNKFGNSSLWTAVFNSRGDGTSIKALLKAGADPRHANNSGKTPLDLANSIANYNIHQFFDDLP